MACCFAGSYRAIMDCQGILVTLFQNFTVGNSVVDPLHLEPLRAFRSLRSVVPHPESRILRSGSSASLYVRSASSSLDH